MNLQELAKRHLEDAITLGYITLETGEKMYLKTSEILSISKSILKEDWTIEEKEEIKSSLPNEMFLNGKEE